MAVSSFAAPVWANGLAVFDGVESTTVLFKMVVFSFNAFSWIEPARLLVLAVSTLAIGLSLGMRWAVLKLPPNDVKINKVQVTEVKPVSRLYLTPEDETPKDEEIANLIKKAGSENPVVSRKALILLQENGTPEQIKAGLDNALKSSNRDVVEYVAKVVKAENLIEELSSGAPSRHGAAARQLTKIGDPAVSTLLNIIKDKKSSARIRQICLRAVVRIAPVSKGVIDILLEILYGKDEKAVRRTAFKIYFQIYDNPSESMIFLAIEDQDLVIQRLGILASVRLERPFDILKMADLLFVKLGHRSVYTRRAASRISDSIISRLIYIVNNNKHSSVRAAALTAVRKLVKEQNAKIKLTSSPLYLRWKGYLAAMEFKPESDRNKKFAEMLKIYDPLKGKLEGLQIRKHTIRKHTVVPFSAIEVIEYMVNKIENYVRLPGDARAKKNLEDVWDQIYTAQLIICMMEILIYPERVALVFDNVHNFEEAIRRLKAELERYPEGGNDKERAIIELIEAVHKKLTTTATVASPLAKEPASSSTVISPKDAILRIVPVFSDNDLKK